MKYSEEFCLQVLNYFLYDSHYIIVIHHIPFLPWELRSDNELRSLSQGGKEGSATLRWKKVLHFCYKVILRFLISQMVKLVGLGSNWAKNNITFYKNKGETMLCFGHNIACFLQHEG